MKSLIFLVAAVLVLTGCRTTKAILIHKAAFDGKIKEVRRHLDGGVDANEATGSGNTPLHAAAFRGQVEVIELLLARGADVNASDVRGWIPLHQAVDQGHALAVELLLAKGASVNARMKGGGFTALDLAQLREYNGLAALIREHGGMTGAVLQNVKR